MIVVVGRVRTDAARRERLIELGQAVARASREEPGCRGYALYEDSEDPNAFVFVEEWVDEAALREHFTTPHIATFMAGMPQTLTEPPDVRFHTVASSMTLADVRSQE